MAIRPVLALLGTLLLAGAAHAAGVPLTLSTSGYLLDAADHPLTRQGVSLRFSVWSDPESTLAENRVWPATESECLVDVENGFYTAIFDGSLPAGCGAGLTSDFLPPTQRRYLQVSVEGTTLTPRMRLGTVPNAAFATQSGDAQALITALAASGTLNAETNPVDWTQLKHVPEGFADGVDLDTTYTAAGGLSLVANAFSVTAGGVTNAMLEHPSLAVIAGTGLTGGGSAELGGSTTLSLADTAVGAGTYTHPSLTIDAQGRITAAASLPVTSGTVTSVATGAGLTGGPITASGTLAIAADGVTNALLASDAASLAKVSGGALTASGGNVGIGTTSPGYPLHVSTPSAGFVAGFINSTGNAGLRIKVNDGSDSLGLGAPWRHALWGSSSESLALVTNNATAVVIDTAGNVGIGTTSPQAKLDVAGGVSVGGGPTPSLLAATNGDGARFTLDGRGAVRRTLIGEDKADLRLPTEGGNGMHVWEAWFHASISTGSKTVYWNTSSAWSADGAGVLDLDIHWLPWYSHASTAAIWKYSLVLVPETRNAADAVLLVTGTTPWFQNKNASYPGYTFTPGASFTGLDDRLKIDLTGGSGFSKTQVLLHARFVGTSTFEPYFSE